MTESNHEEPKESSNDDVKQSFAWGQLFAGSIINGFAVWKLGHKLTGTEPSKLLKGLSSAYEQVRDFLLMPLQWLTLDLTSSEKNLLTICIVLAASMVRAVTGFRRLLRLVLSFFIAGLSISIGALLLIHQLLGLGVVDSLDPFGVRPVILILTVVVICIALINPLLDFAGWVERSPQLSRMVLLNIVFAMGWGLTLLLLSWATS